MTSRCNSGGNHCDVPKRKISQINHCFTESKRAPTRAMLPASNLHRTYCATHPTPPNISRICIELVTFSRWTAMPNVSTTLPSKPAPIEKPSSRDLPVNRTLPHTDTLQLISIHGFLMRRPASKELVRGRSKETWAPQRISISSFAERRVAFTRLPKTTIIASRL